jgi:hypothetical protein
MALQDSPQPTLHQDAEARTLPLDSVSQADQGLHHAQDHEDDHEHAFEWLEALRIGIVALASAAVWFRWEPYSGVSVIGILGLVIGGWPIFKEAFENVDDDRNRRGSCDR